MVRMLSGRAAKLRFTALNWLTQRSGGMDPTPAGRKAMAFNLTVLSNLLGGTEPDFSGVDLLIEDVAEHEYRIDRARFI